MIIKKILSLAASIISFFILQLFLIINSNSQEDNIKYYSNDNGVLSLMYHRFNENKYPSTNIRMEIFDQQMLIIKKLGLKYSDPKLFLENFSKPKKEKKILLTIDDGFKSFYTEAWPYLKKNKIPFILFVSTEPIGKKGYMNWGEIKEIEKSEFGHIGHHSHTHSPTWGHGRSCCSCRGRAGASNWESRASTQHPRWRWTAGLSGSQRWQTCPPLVCM